MCTKIVLVLALLATCGNCADIEFYSENNYIGLLPNVRSISGRFIGGWLEAPSNCLNFPAIHQRTVSSVKVNEKCVLLFSETGCQGDSIKLDANTPSISDLVGSKTHDNFDDRAVSYRLCYEEEGGSVVSVDFYNSTGYQDPVLHYTDICKCVTIPKDQAGAASIDNHHSCLRLFSLPECAADSALKLDVFAGKSSLSADLTGEEIYGNIQSFRPCVTPEKCYSLEASIYAFQVAEGAGASNPTTSTMSMAAKTRFHNNGSATVIQEYSARRSVREVTEVEKITFHRSIEKWGVSASLSTTVSTGFIGLGVEISASVSSAYENTQENSEQNRELHITETTTEFEVSTKIEVPPCSVYVVDTSVKVIEDYPMTYNAYFMLTGKFGSDQMSAEELQGVLDGIEGYNFNHTIDPFHVGAYASAVIKASFGVESEITGEGSRIRNCLA